MESPSLMASKKDELANQSSISLDSRITDEEKVSSFGSSGSEDSTDDEDIALPPDSKLVVRIDGKDDGKDHGNLPDSKLVPDGKSEQERKQQAARTWLGMPWWQCALFAAGMAAVLALIAAGATLLGLALGFHCDDVVIRIDNLDFFNMTFSQKPVDASGSSGSGRMLMLNARLNVSSNVYNPNGNTMVVDELFIAIDGMDKPMTNVTLPGFTLDPKGNLTQDIQFVVTDYPLLVLQPGQSLLNLADSTKNMPFKLAVKSLGHLIYHGINTPAYYYTYLCNVTFTPGVDDVHVVSCHKIRAKA